MNGMKIKMLIGVIMVVLGIISLAYEGITWTREEQILDLGPIQATAEKRETLPIPRIAGIILLVGGVVTIALARKG